MMSKRLLKSEKRFKASVFNIFESDLHLTLATANKIGQLLSKQDTSVFAPWRNWMFPFTEKETESDSANGYIHVDTLGLLNDAYKVLNMVRCRSEVNVVPVAVDALTPNPYWNSVSDKLIWSCVKFWAIAIHTSDIAQFPYCTICARIKHNTYQITNHQHQLAALRMLGVCDVFVALVDVEDDRMQQLAELEKACFKK